MNIRNSFLWLLWPILLSCVSPSEQQANKEKLLEGLKDHQVVKVTEEQIMASAFNQGQRVVALIDSTSSDLAYWSTDSGQQYLDSLSSTINHGSIKMVMSTPSSPGLGTEEMALLDAYLYSAEQGDNLNDNVQQTGDGQYLLYTSPLITEEGFQGMWSVLLSRKTLIRNME